MLSRLHPRLRFVLAGIAALAAVIGLALSPLHTQPARAASMTHMRLQCEENSFLCTEALDSLNYEGVYTGHDEPSVLFYSNTPGSGNSNIYHLKLPKDPPTLPTQDGTGGTFNFQLHPAFWFGMAMCDTQSAPHPSAITTCAADSDTNIFENSDKTAPDYIGNHPGTAFMEMQFYPPGWVPWPAGNSCDARKWCAALNIDSLTEDLVTGQLNNADCVDNVTGVEPVNFAFITNNGVAQAPSNPVQSTLDTFTPNPATDFFMSSGDELVVDMHDTSAGFTVIIHDETTGTTGSMTASVANQFGQVKWDPNGTTCENIPAAYHPMYATSNEHTRVVWAAHSYNVAFSDEIGHFEYCAAVTREGGRCTSPSATDSTGPDRDDRGCFSAASSTRVQIGGCFGTDIDFDGVPYQTVWPGSIADHGLDRRLHPRPILFTSPLFNGSQNYGRVAFEADLPRITAPDVSNNNACNRSTGADCFNPPLGANFYPIYTTRGDPGECVWQEGGANIPGTNNTFGGTSTAEYGPLLNLVYPSSNASGFVTRFNNFRQVLSTNPCIAGSDGGDMSDA